MLADLVTPLAAFALGAALARANSCSVASVQRLVFARRGDWLAGIAVAISWAGLTLAIFSIALPQVVILPRHLPVDFTVLAGGVLLGMGATINQGCFLGSVTRFGRGELPYLFTLIGVAIAMLFVPVSKTGVSIVSASGDAVLHPTGMINLISLGFIPFALFGLRRWWFRRHQTMLALIAVGIAGGTVYACNPDWSYSSGLYRLFDGRDLMRSLLDESATVALIAGVALSAALAGRFSVDLGTVRAAVTRLTGGFLMGIGAMLIPGGNDMLMLWAIPGLTLYGLIAYIVMIGTIAGILVLRRFASQARQSRAG